MKLKFSIFILIIIASVSISSCIFWESEITYEVVFDTSENTTFYIPLPLEDSNNEKADVMDNLRVIEGEADWEIVDTVYGKALEVHTTNPCRLLAKKKYGYKNSEKGDEWLQNYNISMISELVKKKHEWDETYNVWIYASNPNSTTRVSLSLDDGWNNLLSYRILLTPSDPFAHIPLKEGWQTVELEKQMVLYD